jgi:hypothetical protein
MIIAMENKKINEVIIKNQLNRITIKTMHMEQYYNSTTEQFDIIIKSHSIEPGEKRLLSIARIKHEARITIILPNYQPGGVNFMIPNKKDTIIIKKSIDVDNKILILYNNGFLCSALKNANDNNGIITSVLKTSSGNLSKSREKK